MCDLVLSGDGFVTVGQEVAEFPATVMFLTRITQARAQHLNGQGTYIG